MPGEKLGQIFNGGNELAFIKHAPPTSTSYSNWFGVKFTLNKGDSVEWFVLRKKEPATGSKNAYYVTSYYSTVKNIEDGRVSKVMDISRESSRIG